MYNRNISEPSTAPCGTPDKTGMKLDGKLSSTTH